MRHSNLVLSVCVLLIATTQIVVAQKKPNIILIYSDDHGWADLGAQGVNKDIKTPNLDAMAKDGVLFSHGYVTAPQCVPSRAGVLSGIYQQKIGVEQNGDPSMALSVITIPERLKEAGYVSCQVGKWHLDNPEGKNAKAKAGDNSKPTAAFQPKDQGFDEYYNGQMNTIQASHDFKGNKLEPGNNRITDNRFRCVWQADAGMQFIKRHANKDPFFLYLAFFTPHVPLESPEPWFSKTPTDLPLERRQALAMIAAMDEGIGNLRKTLKEEGIEKNTIIFFIGDNGAPLRPGAWNGSLNLPLTGEKGMLTDGGIRTPFLAVWPGTFPAGKVYDPAVSSLDVAATALAVAGLPKDNLDGVNILPFVSGKSKGNPHEALFWRWRSQAAVLSGKYKFVMVGPDEKYLFDTTIADGETKNLIKSQPKIATDLEAKLMTWNATLPAPGLPRPTNLADDKFFDFHVEKNENSSQPKKK